MENLKFNSGIVRIKVNEYDDVILLDSTDLNIFEKFASLYKKMEKIAENANNEATELKKKYSDVAEENTDIEMVQDYLNLNIRYSKSVMKELNVIFGEDFTDKVFRANYELNKCFVPDELVLVELVESLVPVLEKTYGERLKRNKSKYNASKRGKHSKTKDELIAEYAEKRKENV